VYLKVIEEGESSGSFTDDFADVTAAGEALGYFVGNGELDCDQGAREGLGLGEGAYYGASVYFTSIADAEAFVAAYDGEVVGIAVVTTFCLD